MLKPQFSVFQKVTEFVNRGFQGSSVKIRSNMTGILI